MRIWSGRAHGTSLKEAAELDSVGSRERSWNPGLRIPIAIEKDFTEISFTVPCDERGMSSVASSGW